MEEQKEQKWPDQKLRSFASITPEEYIDERLNQFRKWYDAKAVTAKRNYQMMKSVTVVGGAIVPVLININHPYIKPITTIISLVVVIFVSLESVFHYREQWKNYRATEQMLAKEYFNFVSGEGQYKKLTKEDAFLLFVDRVETAIESENASTLNVMTTISEQKMQQPTNNENIC